MLAGAVQGVIGFYDHNIQLQSLGKYTESVVQLAARAGRGGAVSRRSTPRSPPSPTSRAIVSASPGSARRPISSPSSLLVKAGLKLSDVTPVPVGAGDTLIAALRKDQVQAAMTTEPTISRLVDTGEARVLVDLRDGRGNTGGTGRPLSCVLPLHGDGPGSMPIAAPCSIWSTRWFARFITSPITTPTRSPTQMPADFYVGDRAMYVAALGRAKEMFTADGRMPAGGPETVLEVLSRFMPGVGPDTIDLARTYTGEFVDAAR